MLTFGQLETLKTIVEAGSFSKAARKLYLSQPAVSQRIRALEETLGIELFDRENSGTLLTPTAEGLEVLKFAIATLESFEALTHRLGAATDHASIVTLGAVGFYMGRYVLPQVLPLIRAEHPDLKLRLVTLDAERLNEAARVGAADLVFMNQSRLDPTLAWQPLWEDEMVMVAHPSRAEELSLAPRAIPLILTPTQNHQQLARQWCAAMNAAAQVVVESISADTLRSAALANLGYALLPEIVVREELAAGSLIEVVVAGLPLRRTIVVAYTAERGEVPAVARFLGALMAARAQLSRVSPSRRSPRLPLPTRDQRCFGRSLPAGS